MALWGDTADGVNRPKFLVDVPGNRGLRETFMTDRGWTKLLDGHNPALRLTEVLVALNKPSLTPVFGNDAPQFTTPEQAVEFGVDVGGSLDVLIIATDIQNDNISFSLVGSPPAFLSLTDNGNGTANLTGTSATTGLHIVEIEADDGIDTSILTFLVCVPFPPVFVQILDTGHNPGFTTFVVPTGVNNIEVECFGARGGNGGNFTGTSGGIPFPPGAGGTKSGRGGGKGGKRRVTGIPVTAGDVLQIAVGELGFTGQNVSGIHVFPFPPPIGGAGGQSFTSSGTFNFPDPGNANGGQGADGLSGGTLPTPSKPNPFNLFMAAGGGGGGATAVASPSGSIFCCAGGGGGGQGPFWLGAFTSGRDAGLGGSTGGAGGPGPGPGSPTTDGDNGNFFGDTITGQSAAGVPGGGGGGFVGGDVVGDRSLALAFGGRNGDSVPQPATDPFGVLAPNNGRVIIRGRQLP